MRESTLEEVQERVDGWINQFEEGYFPPLSMLAVLMEEVGELGKEINHKEGYKPKKDGKKGDIGKELGDVLVSLVCIANGYDIDLEEKFKEVMEKYDKRDSERWTKKG